MHGFILPLLATLMPHTAPPVLAVKTNVPAWGATVMNIEPELRFSRNWSVDLPVMWCPWFISEKRALRVFASQPELRYHFSPSIKGHYIGVHGSLAWFNMKNGDYRYQDINRPLLGAGISYGYAITFARHWTADFSIGAGYANLRYERFYNVENGARKDTRQTSYWGIDRLIISIGYLIDL